MKFSFHSYGKAEEGWHLRLELPAKVLLLIALSLTDAFPSLPTEPGTGTGSRPNGPAGAR
ncbi:MAG: hypothetical protein ABR540_00925 [Acidimicrobiales bacterium]